MDIKYLKSIITNADDTHTLYYNKVMRLNSSIEYETWDVIHLNELPIKIKWRFIIDDGFKKFTFQSETTCLLNFIKNEQPYNELMSLLYLAANDLKVKLEKDIRNIDYDTEAMSVVANELIQIAKNEQLL